MPRGAAKTTYAAYACSESQKKGSATPRFSCERAKNGKFESLASCKAVCKAPAQEPAPLPASSGPPCSSTRDCLRKIAQISGLDGNATALRELAQKFYSRLMWAIKKAIDLVRLIIGMVFHLSIDTLSLASKSKQERSEIYGKWFSKISAVTGAASAAVKYVVEYGVDKALQALRAFDKHVLQNARFMVPFVMLLAAYVARTFCRAKASEIQARISDIAETAKTFGAQLNVPLVGNMFSSTWHVAIDFFTKGADLASEIAHWAHTNCSVREKEVIENLPLPIDEWARAPEPEAEPRTKPFGPSYKTPPDDLVRQKQFMPDPKSKPPSWWDAKRFGAFVRRSVSNPKWDGHYGTKNLSDPADYAYKVRRPLDGTWQWYGAKRDLIAAYGLDLEAFDNVINSGAYAREQMLTDELPRNMADRIEPGLRLQLRSTSDMSYPSEFNCAGLPAKLPAFAVLWNWSIDYESVEQEAAGARTGRWRGAVNSGSKPFYKGEAYNFRTQDQNVHQGAKLAKIPADKRFALDDDFIEVPGPNGPERVLLFKREPLRDNTKQPLQTNSADLLERQLLRTQPTSATIVIVVANKCKACAEYKRTLLEFEERFWNVAPVYIFNKDRARDVDDSTKPFDLEEVGMTKLDVAAPLTMAFRANGNEKPQRLASFVGTANLETLTLWAVKTLGGTVAWKQADLNH